MFVLQLSYFIQQQQWNIWRLEDIKKYDSTIRSKIKSKIRFMKMADLNISILIYFTSMHFWCVGKYTLQKSKRCLKMSTGYSLFWFWCVYTCNDTEKFKYTWMLISHPCIFIHVEQNAYWFADYVIMRLYVSLKGKQNLILKTCFIPENCIQFRLVELW